MGTDTSLLIHTDVWWKWRTLIVGAEWLRILIIRPLCTVFCQDGAEQMSQQIGTESHAGETLLTRETTPFIMLCCRGVPLAESTPCVSSPWFPFVQRQQKSQQQMHLLSFPLGSCACFVVTHAAVPYWPNGLSVNALKWPKTKTKQAYGFSCEGMRLRSVSSLKADTSK